LASHNSNVISQLNIKRYDILKLHPQSLCQSSEDTTTLQTLSNNKHIAITYLNTYLFKVLVRSLESLIIINQHCRERLDFSQTRDNKNTSSFESFQYIC